MHHAELEERVHALVAQAAAAKAPGVVVAPGLSLRRDLGFDSLGLVSLLNGLGEALGVDLDDLVDCLADTPVSTVADLVTLGAKVSSSTAATQRG